MYLVWTQFTASVQSLINNRIKGVIGVDLGEGPPFRESMWEGNAKSKEEMGDWAREQNSNESLKRDWASFH